MANGMGYVSDRDEPRCHLSTSHIERQLLLSKYLLPGLQPVSTYLLDLLER